MEWRVESGEWWRDETGRKMGGRKKWGSGEFYSAEFLWGENVEGLRLAEKLGAEKRGPRMARMGTNGVLVKVDKRMGSGRGWEAMGCDCGYCET